MKAYDIVICGGGVIGSSIAYFLSRDKDLKIALVDYKKPGNASRASAGGLWAMGESTGLGCGVILFKTLSKQISEGTVSGASTEMKPHIMPTPFFDMAMQSNSMYPALSQELLEKHNVDMKFEKTGLKFVIFDEYDKIYAQHIADAVPDRKQHIRWIDREQLQQEEPHLSANALGAMEFGTDHQINPYRLNEAYVEGARQNGVDLFLNTEVTGIERQGRKVVSVTTSMGRLKCGTLINAAGAWAEKICQWATGMPLPVFPVKGQVIVSERLPKILNGCITTSDCYIAQKDNGEILIGSTTEEKGYDTTQDINLLRQLAIGAQKSLPILKSMNIKRCWTGLRPGSPDELPILGPVPGVEGYLNACGHFRTGMLTSAITGQLLNELVREQQLTLDISPFLYDRFISPSGEMTGSYHLEASL
ncbi:NAD(P)/FAD-dependent oxidoreductase [Vibrio marisflavi]|uniref:Hydrogen cyanide synthase subunit HcnC n=1 Tax=Vibrio marisflavi CECT 7928 TaxID=634439 RepID=A0ABM8ZYP2_9VIBR|nr:FAD-dependent oxidoreductase [Vibrio marisflavi]CAH0536071.1 Hydrogen cyanide synthase subunit HcnC [Vibrio marisflavi CECT 7928]